MVWRCWAGYIRVRRNKKALREQATQWGRATALRCVSRPAPHVPLPLTGNPCPPQICLDGMEAVSSVQKGGGHNGLYGTALLGPQAAETGQPHTAYCNSSVLWSVCVNTMHMQVWARWVWGYQVRLVLRQKGALAVCHWSLRLAGRCWQAWLAYTEHRRRKKHMRGKKDGRKQNCHHTCTMSFYCSNG